MGSHDDLEPDKHQQRSYWFVTIFGSHTKDGRRFDVILLWAIILSVLAVMLESVQSIAETYGTFLYVMEWVFTILFTIEYVARIMTVKKPFNYIFSFFGLIDLLSIIPTFIGIFISGSQSLMVIRILRFMRIFRIFKLVGFLNSAKVLRDSLKASRSKIIVFLTAVLLTVVILGTLMYIIEDETSGFTSIPRSIYWAIVTLTTVGYGDIAPATALGQALASCVMIIGYAIIAVPTGIVSAEMVKSQSSPSISGTSQKACPNCSKEGHDSGAQFCMSCGHSLQQ